MRGRWVGVSKRRALAGRYRLDLLFHTVPVFLFFLLLLTCPVNQDGCTAVMACDKPSLLSHVHHSGREKCYVRDPGPHQAAGGKPKKTTAVTAPSAVSLSLLESWPLRMLKPLLVSTMGRGMSPEARAAFFYRFGPTEEVRFQPCVYVRVYETTVGYLCNVARIRNIYIYIGTRSMFGLASLR